MEPTYQRLTFEEREEISRGLASRLSIREIARRLSRSPSTISRETKKDRKHWMRYRAIVGQHRMQRAAALRRKGKMKLSSSSSLLSVVTRKLALAWSPEQIVVYLKKEYPRDMTMRISHEAIYQYIYVLPRGTLRKKLILDLRQQRAFRRSRVTKRGTTAEKRGKIADMISIEERPLEVRDRTIPGHWEGDIVVGDRKKPALGTLVERTTRYALLVPLKEKNASIVRQAYAKALRQLPKDLVKTLTYDQGKEMSEHVQFTVDTGVRVYFAHPHSPWERGTNENTNGLIRQFFPKGTDFSKVSTKQIRHVQNLLNERPRKTLDWKTPKEAFNHLVALEH